MVLRVNQGLDLQKQATRQAREKAEAQSKTQEGKDGIW
jgi:hypothetical protein